MPEIKTRPPILKFEDWMQVNAKPELGEPARRTKRKARTVSEDATLIIPSSVLVLENRKPETVQDDPIQNIPLKNYPPQEDNSLQRAENDDLLIRDMELSARSERHKIGEAKRW
jgi:hypothetical protein